MATPDSVVHRCTQNNSDIVTPYRLKVEPHSSESGHWDNVTFDRTLTSRVEAERPSPESQKVHRVAPPGSLVATAKASSGRNS